MPDQIDLFSYSMPRFKIDKPIRLIELFAGIGSQYASLKRLGADVTPWKVIEFDRFAVASYNAVHGTNFTPKDITQTHAEDLEITDTSEYIYILTYSFPCVDLSLAGHQAGLDREKHTRSGLLWEVERILDECTELPQLLLLENVPQLISQKNIKNFWEWRRKLESLGYSNYVQLLNAKDYGIPQNRNRCFMVSILGDYYYEFPKKKKLKLRLKDLLEENVDEKYYLSDAMMNYCLGVNQKESKFPRKERFLDNINRANQDIGNAISTNAGSRPVDNFIKVNKEGITQETFDPIGGGQMDDAHIYPCLTPGRKNKRQNGPRFRGDGDEMFTLTAQDQHGIAEVREIMNSEKQKAERKDIKKAERYCEYCGKPLERKRFNGRLEDFGVFMKRSYCDRECMKRAYLKIGETDSDWSAAHGSARNINKLILKKDHCEICGRTENLDMHHIDGNWQNNNLDNLMCLCRSCHMKIERNDNKRKEGEHTNIRIRKLTPNECWRSINGFHR